MSILNNTTVNGVVTQTQPATQANHLLRLGEAQAMLTTGPTGATGANGTSSFTYIAFASDTNGTGFSLTPTTGLDYVAFLTSATAITAPAAANFAGLWTLFVGAVGAAGTAGAAGAAGQSSYVYVGYANDTNGTGFSLTPSSGLGYIAFLSTTTALMPPVAANFAGLWKQYQNLFTVNSPITYSGGALGANAASANTPNFLVQRDGSGNFSAGQASVTSMVIGGTSAISYAGGALNISTGVVVAGMTITGLSGVLVATDGVVAGGATTDALPQGTTNLYFTQAQVLATDLTGISTTHILLTTDTVLSAFGKLDALLGAGGTLTGNFDLTGNVTVGGNLQMGSNKVIDSSNYYYDSGGHKILSTQQAAYSAPTLTGTYASDYANLQAWVAALQSVLTAHGLMA